MKKLIYTIALLSIALIFNNKSIAQNQYSKQCGFNEMMDYQEAKIPGYKEQVNNLYLNHVIKANKKNIQKAKAIYTVPVVFHVVWNSATPAQNLDDSVLIEQIAVLNEDYSRTNADTGNLRSEFLPIVGGADIQFQLACVDTNGNPTNGIVRVQTTATFGGGLIPDMASISNIQKSANGGSDPWDQTKYLNIWIGDINGGGQASLLGIATPPPGLANWPANSTPTDLLDGAIIQYNAFGRNNPNIFGSGVVINGRTVTHEVGHYLGVRHCAENTFGGLLGSICGDDDGLTDTPNCDQSQQGCDITRNSCVDAIPGTTGDVHDMVENYMDYSDQDCQNSFTVGQVAIMRSVLENERASLLTSPAINNCSVTGIAGANTENDFIIYPNPSTGTFKIELNKAKNIQVSILNSLGQEVVPAKIYQNKSTINVKIDAVGLYFVVINNNNQLTFKKIIVQ